jgi:hypothetical protein
MNHVDKLKNKLSNIKEKLLPTFELTNTYIDPIYQFDLSTEIDAGATVNLIFKYKEHYPISNKRSNILSWNSDYDTHKKTTDFDILIKIIENKVKLIEDTRNGFVNKVLDSWVAIYNKTEYAQWHNHSDTHAKWAAVYYAKAEENCSAIVFKNLEIVPKTNMLLIFPSRMNHMVRKSISDTERIIFAANLNLVSV